MLAVPFSKRQAPYLRRAAALLVAAWVTAVSGCAAVPGRQLHSVTGNLFTLFPTRSGERPAPLRCTQAAREERYACFAQRLRERAAQAHVAGGFVMLDADALHVLPVGAGADGARVSADTEFPLGSLTKMFTGMAAVSMSEDGSLDLRRPVAEYLSELSATQGVGQASLHQLLTHTAGLPNPELCEQGSTTAADVLARYGAQPLWAAPGTVYSYSNLGYVVAGAVLARVAGVPLQAVLRARVLKPAGVHEARFDGLPEGIDGQRAKGVAPLVRCPALMAAGGLVLSLRALGRWLEVLQRPEVSQLAPQIVWAATAPRVATYDRPGAAYGYGVASFKHGAATWLSHAGALDDFSSFIAWSHAPEFGAAAVVNARQPPAAVAVFRAASTFAQAPLDWAPPHRPDHPLEHYVGTYRDARAGLGTLRVALEDGKLMIDYPQGPPPLLPVEFSFAFTADAPLAHYVVTAVGVGERIDAPESAAAP